MQQTLWSIGTLVLSILCMIVDLILFAKLNLLNCFSKLHYKTELWVQHQAFLIKSKRLNKVLNIGRVCIQVCITFLWSNCNWDCYKMYLFNVRVAWLSCRPTNSHSIRCLDISSTLHNSNISYMHCSRYLPQVD